MDGFDILTERLGIMDGAAIALFVGAYVLVAVAVGIVLRVLRRRQILDRPTHRSSHTSPTPRGAGLGLMAVLIPATAAFMALAVPDPALGALPSAAVMGGALLLLAAVSWADDLNDLGAAPRLAAHTAAAALGVWALPGPVFAGLLPPAADFVLAAVLLVWFVNLFNFMDGIDAISGVEAIVLGLGTVVVGKVGGGLATEPLALMVVGAALGFLVWNWPPARIFLGDVGSIPLGFLLGWLLLDMAANGHWLAALILPLYYLADSGLTLCRRLLRRENITVAHRAHFYQRAVQRGRSHGAVSVAVLMTGTVLIGHAAIAARFAAAVVWPALLSAAVIVVLLLVWMRAPVRGRSPAEDP